MPLRPANLDRLRPNQSHDPLAIMLVLLQFSVGALGVGMVGLHLRLIGESALCFVLVLAASTATLGLGAATMHLGRPAYAFRAFLGWRTSWMSREVLVIGAYVPAVALAAIASSIVPLGSAGDPDPGFVWRWAADSQSTLRSVAVVAGVIGIFTSMMIYVDTQRAAWSFSRTGPLFLGTLVALGGFGVAAATVLAAIFASEGSPVRAIPFLALGLVGLGAKLRLEHSFQDRSRVGIDGSTALSHGARLLAGPLRGRVQIRLACAGIATVAALVSIVSLRFGASVFASSLVIGVPLFCLCGEFVERHLFFTAEASPGMPGH